MYYGYGYQGYRRRLTNEEYFVSHKEGYKYILKEKPDLESLVVITKRDHHFSKAKAIAGIVLGSLLAIIGIGIYIIMYNCYELSCIKKNNTLECECIYYDDKKKTIIFYSMETKIWYEFPPEKLWNIYGSEGDGRFGFILKYEDEGEIEDVVYLDLGYAKEKEKMACIQKMAAIRQGTFVSY